MIFVAETRGFEKELPLSGVCGRGFYLFSRPRMMQLVMTQRTPHGVGMVERWSLQGGDAGKLVPVWIVMSNLTHRELLSLDAMSGMTL